MNLRICDTYNFGDAVAKVFWEKLTGKTINYDPRKDHYITVGSVMCLVKNNSIIFGAGFMSEGGDLGGERWLSNEGKKFVRPLDVIAVRGPLTRKKLLKINVNCPENYGDPLILMPCIYDKTNVVTDNIVGIVPHYCEHNHNNVKLLKKNLESQGYKVNVISISVGDDYKTLIDAINGCKYIISSSLHGVIMGLVYKKNTIHIEFSNKVFGKGFKFQDFFKSVGIEYKNVNVYDKSVLNNVIKMDYNNLLNLGLKFIALIPFIESDDRKRELSDMYKKFYQ